MAAKLKVFVTSDGLTDYVVATTSRPKALAAWGIHQDLFKAGRAHETDEAAVTTAARAQPGEVLRRPAGSRAALARLKVPRPAKGGASKSPTKAKLKRIADLEARLEGAVADHAAALADLDAKRAALEAKHARDRQKLEAALSAARA